MNSLSAGGSVSDRSLLVKYAKVILLSCLCGVCVAALMLLLFAFVMSLRDIPVALVNPLAVFAVASGSFMAGLICAKKIHQKGLFYGAVCGAFMFVLLMLTSATISGEPFGMLLFVKFAIVLCSAMLGGILGVNMRKKRR